MESILDWNTQEGIIFQGGSGSGINLSKIRCRWSRSPRAGSPPARSASCAAPTPGRARSSRGGGTRRAAKMVVLDVDHPDIEDFIWCKAREEEKAAALKAAGFDMRLDSEAFASVQYQNANNSVRVSDEFMKAVEEDGDWELTARVDGRAIKTVKARDLMHQIADAAWRCADPGVQYDTTINRWHTAPSRGGSTPRTRAASTCTSTTRPAIWLAEPDEVPRARTGPSTSRPLSTPSTSSSSPRRSSSGRRATRPRRSAATPARSARSGSGTPTSAPT